MAKRTKKKLTLNQSWTIISLICGTVLIGEIILFFTLKNPVSLEQNFVLIASLLSLLIALFILLYKAFKIDDLLFNKEAEEATNKLLTDLSKNDFTQVYLNIETNEITQRVLRNEDYKFFAKLTEDNNIVIIAKNKYDKEIYKEEVENPLYFYYHFKV